MRTAVSAWKGLTRLAEHVPTTAPAMITCARALMPTLTSRQGSSAARARRWHGRYRLASARASQCEHGRPISDLHAESAQVTANVC
jgi:hypothetical protein